MLPPEREQQIIDAICRARDADIKEQFDTYGAVFPYSSDMWLRAKSAAVKDVYGEGADKYGSAERDIVDRVFDQARSERRLWTRTI
jgi:hypothetical protein